MYMRFIFLLLVFAPPLGAQEAGAPDAAGAADPFIRGLKRLDEVERDRQNRLQAIERELEAARKAVKAAQDDARGIKRGRTGKKLKPAHQWQRELAALPPAERARIVASLDIPPAQGEAGFARAFAAPRYRLDGLLVSFPPETPVIHVTEDDLRRGLAALYWDGARRHWVYRIASNESYVRVAKKFKMHPHDLLAMNNVSNPDNLAHRQTLIVSPRDNGALVHTVRKGETLNGLARLYGVPVQILKSQNELSQKGRLIIGQRLYIRAQTIDRQAAAQAVPAPTELDLNAERMARKYYVRLARFGNLKRAMRGAREFYQDNRAYMDSDLILRLEADNVGRHAYFMDIGPMQSEKHAAGYCTLFIRQRLVCEIVRRVPGAERLNTFESRAVVRVSPSVFYDEEISTDDIAMDKTKDIEYQLTEGQILGVDEGMVVKITPDNIFVTGADNELLVLDLNYLPEVDREMLAAQQAAEREAALAGAAEIMGEAVGVAEGTVTGEAAGTAEGDVPDAPNDEDSDKPNLAERLAAGEAKRRQGSTQELEE